MSKIKVYRGLSEVADLPLNAGTFSKQLMGAHELTFSLKTPAQLDLRVGDTITYKGEQMTINKEPDVAISHIFQYDVVFQGNRHTLERFILKDEGSLVFDYTGQLDDFMFMFLECLTDIDDEWTIGDLEENTELVTVSFDKVDMLTALSDIAEAFGCEWQIVGKEISVVKHVGNATSLEFSYGKGNGLYSLSQLRNDQSKIVTRAYAVGGSNNLPAGYAHSKLTLEDYLEDEDAVALYGIREGVFEDENIFPKRTSTATAVGQINESTYTLTDSTLDFDLNGQRIDGQEAYIVFKSGMLNGQQFKILAYNNSTKTIRYEANKDANGNLIPFGAVIAEVGDSYTLIGIRMPSSYVDNAIEQLEEKREEYLNENKHPKVRYELDVDILHLKRLGVEPQEGDIIKLIDDRFNIDVDVRVTSISYPAHFDPTDENCFLTNDMKFSCELSNDIHYYRLSRLEKEIKDTKKVVTQVSNESWENNRRNVAALNEFIGKIFDPDGKLQTAIVQGIAGLFGTESMYFDLENVEIAVNAGSDANRLTLTAGKLIHRSYEVSGLGYIWELDAFDEDELEPTKTYYLSAKCSKVALTGEWVLSETQMATESEAGYYHFNLGVLSSVIEGARSFHPTRLFTLISGGNIETDVISARLINVQKLFAQIIEVGSNGYTNAGISGLSDNNEESVRFWAGSEAIDRDTAPFRVLDDGSMTALKGVIGGFNIESDALSAGSINTWTPNGKTVYMTPEYFLLRDNGAIAGERREFAWNLYKDLTGQQRAASASIYNTTNTYSSLQPYTNVGMDIEVSGGNKNVAINVISGESYFKSIHVGVQKITSANTIINDQATLVVIKSLIGGTGNPNTFFPPNPEIGRHLIIKNASGNGTTLQANGHDILNIDNSYISTTLLLNKQVRSFTYDGTNWIEITTH